MFFVFLSGVLFDCAVFCCFLSSAWCCACGASDLCEPAAENSTGKTKIQSKKPTGKLTQHTITCLREFKEFFGVTFKISPDSENNTIVMSCLGSGYKNISRKAL